MIGSERKAKDDFIGGKDFSRVRRFDDETRKARIFAPNSINSVDVEKLACQVKEKEEWRLFEENKKKENEKLRSCQVQNWKIEEDKQRQKKFQENTILEEFWAKQAEEHKERWKMRSVHAPVSDHVGIIPAKRYQLQDNEVLRDAEVTRRVSEARIQQINNHKLKQNEDIEDKRQHDLNQEIGAKQWERAEEERQEKSY